jgi:hypothetical protein
MGNAPAVNRQAITVISEMLVDIYIKQTIECQTLLDIQQRIDLVSIPYQQAQFVPITSAVEANPACIQCMANVEQYQSLLLNNYVNLRARGVRNLQPFPTTEAFLARVYADVQSLCATACKSLTVTNVTQQLNLRLNASCASNSTQDFNFYQNLETTLFQSMVNDKDFFSALVAAFQARTGQGTVNEQIASLISQVHHQMQDVSDIKMGTLMLETQNIRVESNGAPVALHNVSQNAMRTYMINNVFESIKSLDIVNDTNFHVVQTLVDKSASLKDIFSTAGNLGQSWFDTLSTVWQIVFIIAIVVVVIILVIWVILAALAYRKAAKDLDFARKNHCTAAEKMEQLKVEHQATQAIKIN